VPIDSRPDHVAIAVPSIEAAGERWHDQLGGAWILPRFASEQAGFANRQLRFRGGAKLELLEPLGAQSFVGRFLDRFGARIHHVTLKVPVLLTAVATVRAAGYDVVDVFAEGDVWHEAFLRPTQVGGLVVQLGWAGQTDEQWADAAGFAPERIPEDGARLLGPTLSHPDLATAEALWTTLGASVTRQGSMALAARWPGSPLSVVVLRGEEAGPIGLRFADAPDLDADARCGPGTLVASPR
jgi:hypothetical protein